MNALSNRLHYILRIACAMCFIGHGAFGIITKPIWCNYFAVFGIGEHLAYKLMPLVGTADILFGLILLFYPIRAVACWLVVWGLCTALLRPLSGEPLAEFFERAGNYGAPFILLLLSGINTRTLFSKINPHDQATPATLTRMTKGLQFIAFLLLAGHGWLNLLEKKGLIAQYGSLNLGDPVTVAHIVGYVEIVGAFCILIKPWRALLLGLFIWKMASELLYPHYEFFEWVERGGSYGVLLALWLIERSRDAHVAPSPSAFSEQRIEVRSSSGTLTKLSAAV